MKLHCLASILQGLKYAANALCLVVLKCVPLKKKITMKTLALITTLGTFLFAASSFAQLRSEVASADIVLKIESSDGNNGLAVCHNPVKNVYYSIFAGNSSYPIETHNSAGESIDSQQAGVDARGMWFNSSCNCLQGTMYNNAGSFDISLDLQGKPSGTQTNMEVYNLDAQGVTTGNGKYVYSYDGYGNILKFKKGSKKAKKLAISNSYVDYQHFNANAIMYTGISGHELGMVNYQTNELVLFSEKKGKLAKVIKINVQEVSISEGFRTSFANGHLFLYDSETRSWYGYSIY